MSRNDTSGSETMTEKDLTADLEESEIELEPHPSGVSHIRISFWTDGDAPGNSPPHESFGGPVHAGEHYALGEEIVTIEEQMTAFIESHLSGECDCLHD